MAVAPVKGLKSSVPSHRLMVFLCAYACAGDDMSAPSNEESPSDSAWVYMEGGNKAENARLTGGSEGPEGLLWSLEESPGDISGWAE